MRALIAVSALLALAACAPQVPDSGAGFDEAALSAQLEPAPLVAPLPAADAISQETLDPGTGVAAPLPPTTGENSDIAAETAAALAAAGSNSGVAPVNASPSNPPPADVNASVISDEQDFGAVASRQSIESDAARIEQARQQRAVVAPAAIPERSGSAGPNIVDYALQTNHPVGTRVYTRSGVNLASRAIRNCGRYPSADQAQIDFLSEGGPERDRMSLDPDGDGYACGWDPAPFRRAVSN